jgi:hypothetical protein
MATLIEWNGKETEIHPKDPQRGFTREELSELTGGGIPQISSLSDGRLMVADELGKLVIPRLPVNLKATKLYQAGSPGSGLAIVGNVVVGCPGEIL